MSRSTRWWGVVLATILGLWAGNVRAHDDDGGWFETETERPLLRIHGSDPYAPPPPDFRSEAPAPREPTRSPEHIEEPRAADSGAAEWEDGGVREDDAEARERALAEFSPQLSRYGRWVEDPFYGRIWVPHRRVVGPDFRPYVSGGHWELTVDDEWVWVSSYPFGWITFHYGRWVWVTNGWAWVPGYVWAPSWVEFRIGPSGYMGWGPAPPYHVWRGGVFVTLGFGRPVPYIFCPTTYVFSRSLHRHVIHDRHRVRSLARDTYRYRPHRTAGFSRVLRGPAPAEARIPPRALPAQRTIARPRAAEFTRAEAPSAAPASRRAFSGMRGREASRFERAQRPSLGSARRAAPSLERPASPPRARAGSRGAMQLAPPAPRSWHRADPGRAVPAARSAPARIRPDERIAAPRRAAAPARGSAAAKKRWGNLSTPEKGLDTGRSRGASPKPSAAQLPRGATHRADAPGARRAPRASPRPAQRRASPKGRGTGR